MDRTSLANELNALLTTELRSLARHVVESKPHLTPKTYLIWRDIEAIVHTSDAHAKRLSALLTRLELSERPAPFNTDVANYHYVNLDSVLPHLIEEKTLQVAAYERAIAHAGNDQNIISELTSLLEDNRSQLAALQSHQESLNVAAV